MLVEERAIVERMNVYVVDDASFIRILCRHYAQKAGFPVIGEAFDGQVALEEISAKQPDCVIMDLALPTINGIDIMKRVNESFPHIQFIVISALDEDFCQSQLQGVKYGNFLTKPFTAERLMQALHEAASLLEKKNHG